MFRTPATPVHKYTGVVVTHRSVGGGTYTYHRNFIRRLEPGVEDQNISFTDQSLRGDRLRAPVRNTLMPPEFGPRLDEPSRKDPADIEILPELLGAKMTGCLWECVAELAWEMHVLRSMWELHGTLVTLSCLRSTRTCIRAC